MAANDRSVAVPDREPVLRDALAAARALSDEEARASCLAALAPALPETERDAVLRDALAAARALSDEEARARCLTALLWLNPTRHR
jgi:hypothetical protein